MKQNTAQNGFSIPEVLVTTFIVALVSISFWAMFSDTFTLSRRLQSTLTIQQELQLLMRRFSAEVRSATQSETGTYAIASASSSQVTFYTDADNDGIVERIRYFVEGDRLRRGVLQPTGDPLAYTGSESVRTLVHNLIATSTPVFAYYDSTYTGTSTALTQPVSTSEVRSIQMTLVVDDDVHEAPPEVTSTTQVTIRTLKDNL